MRETKFYDVFERDSTGKPTLSQRRRIRWDERLEKPLEIMHLTPGYLETCLPNPPEWGRNPNWLDGGAALLESRTTAYHDFVDIVGSGARRLWYKPCDHLRYVQWLLNDIPQILAHKNGPALMLNRRCEPFVMDQFLSSVPEPPVSVLEDAAAQAQKRFLAIVEQTTSIPNFVFEILATIVDVTKALKKCWKNLVRSLKDLKRVFGDLITYFRHGGMSGTTRRIGRGARDYGLKNFKNADTRWLQLQFALMPSWRDILATVDIVRQARKTLIHLRKVNFTLTTERYRRPSIWTPPADTSFEVPVPLSVVFATGGEPEQVLIAEPLDVSMRFTLDEWNLRFVACGLVEYQIPPELLDESIEALTNIIRQLAGFTDPFSILWEATPFSWAIDYALSEQAKLERWIQFQSASTTAMPLAIVHDTGHSLRLDCSWFVDFVQRKQGYQDEVTPLGRCLYRRYRRLQGLPTGSSWFFRNPVTDLRKDSLLISVVTQRLWRNR